MPYTSQGWMSHADIQETLKDMDMGSTEIDLADPPEWFEPPVECPVCEAPMSDHEAVRVADASGEVFSCLPLEAADWLELPQDEPDFPY
jgi:hypothetical protein